MGHDRGAGLKARAGDRPVDLLDVLGHPGGVGGALQEGGPDVRSLDPALHVLDEVVGHRVDVAVREVVGQVVVAVDARAGDDPHAGLIGHALHEAHVPPAEHGGRIDDRLDPPRLGRVDRLERRVELELLVVAIGPLRGHRLVAKADVLVDEHDAQLLGLDRPLHCLYALAIRFSLLLSAHGAACPNRVSSRSCFFRTLPLGLRGSGSSRRARYCGTLKSARCRGSGR